MNFELRLTAEEVDNIVNAIQAAENDGAHDLTISISGTVDDGKPAKVKRMQLYGMCTNEYLVNI